MKLYSVMDRLFKSVHEVIVLFSTGKDSIVTLDLCIKYLKEVSIVYMYFIKDLSYKEDILKYYEDRYNKKINRIPHPELTTYYNENVFGCNITNKKEPKISISENDNLLRYKFNKSYIAYGYKKTDSLSRRGQLWHGDGIDKRNKKIFPVANFSEKDIFYYIKKNKLKLPPEYKSGYRDINTFFERQTLEWLINNYPDDYKRVKEQYPLIESVLLR